MKLSQLLEAGQYTGGPGDYRPGDENNPRSPDYDPKIKRVNRGPSAQDKEDAFQINQQYADRRASKREQEHEASLTDVKTTDDYVHGREYAPVKTTTGIAADRANAYRAIDKIKYVAHTTKSEAVEPLDDGRFKFTVVYVM